MKKELNQISVDIILPNYNSAPYLSETIDSIIHQTFKNWKLIIVDGNSNMETKMGTALQMCRAELVAVIRDAPVVPLSHEYTRFEKGVHSQMSTRA